VRGLDSREMRTLGRGRRWVVAGLVVCVVAAVSIGIGVQSAAAAPSSQPPAAVSIAALFGSIKFAVTHLQKSPTFIRQLAAKAIVAEAKLLLTPHPRLLFGKRRGAVARAALVAPPGTVVGGLVLDSYCQALGFDHSTVNGPIVAPGAAFQWNCVAASGSETPISLQGACLYQYPGQVTIAYPQDPDNAYSWVCIAPTTGSTTDPSTDTTVDTVTTTTGAATLITTPASDYVAVNDNGDAATLQLQLQTDNGSLELQTQINKNLQNTELTIIESSS